MFRILLTMLFLALCTQASSKTLRYTFDVVSSDIYFSGLYQFSHDPSGPGTGEGADTSIGPEELAAFTADNHSLKSIIGQTGTVVVEIKDDGGFHGDFTCISGFLCPVLRMTSVSGYDPDSSLRFLNFDVWEWQFFTNSSGERLLTFHDDGKVHNIVEWNSAFYFLWNGPQAKFEISDVIRTEVSAAPAPVPLPAAAWLLGLGMAALGLGARHPAA